MHQRHSLTDKTDRQRSDSNNVGRTVLQTVAQNYFWLRIYPNYLHVVATVVNVSVTGEIVSSRRLVHGWHGKGECARIDHWELIYLLSKLIFCEAKRWSPYLLFGWQKSDVCWCIVRLVPRLRRLVCVFAVFSQAVCVCVDWLLYAVLHCSRHYGKAVSPLVHSFRVLFTSVGSCSEAQTTLGYQSTRHTVMSSHGQLVTNTSRHTVNSSQAST